jgi:hypothetical protein
MLSGALFGVNIFIILYRVYLEISFLKLWLLVYSLYCFVILFMIYVKL